MPNRGLQRSNAHTRRYNIKNLTPEEPLSEDQRQYFSMSNLSRKKMVALNKMIQSRNIKRAVSTAKKIASAKRLLNKLGPLKEFFVLSEVRDPSSEVESSDEENNVEEEDVERDLTSEEESFEEDPVEEWDDENPGASSSSNTNNLTSVDNVDAMTKAFASLSPDSRRKVLSVLTKKITVIQDDDEVEEYPVHSIYKDVIEVDATVMSSLNVPLQICALKKLKAYIPLTMFTNNA